MLRFFSTILFFQFIFFKSFSQTTIPFAKESTTSETKIPIDSLSYIFTNTQELKDELETFNTFLKNANQKPLSVKENDKNTVILILDKNAKEEEYHIQLKRSNVEITGSESGVFYGLMSLFQWMTQSAEKEKIVLKDNIHDYPNFSWRGLHLDVCRHFFPTGFIKKYIDILAMHKMNTFHWHLTDDQGWRIEIKKYPLLTAVGSKRKESILEKNFDPYIGDKTPVEGFYTQEQIKDIVKYAALRHVTIVPEIEMPGHAQAALAAYPEFSCDKEPTEVWTQWGVSEKIFCSKDETIQFLKDVLDEVMELFPSQYIHIGGDEAPKNAWKKCPACQRNMKINHLKNENELQSYFIEQIDEYVTSKGKSIIGWDEILEGGLAQNAAVMSWRGEQGGIEAAKQHHHAVMSPGGYCYFDHYQDSSKSEPLAFGGFTPIEKVYAYNPIPKTLNPSEAQYILGAQGNLWSEYLQVSSQVEYMALPRMCALSEVLWTGEHRPGYENFKTRLKHHFNTLDKYQIYYSRVIYNIKADEKTTAKGKEIRLIAPFKEGQIFYTLDNNHPTTHSTFYQANSAIILPKNTTLKAQYFENNQAKSKIFIIKNENE
ncbi:MAG TPA: family 20 glycosylhydrolase [Chitinophagaceae bacterium]|nr:family 20 glycosylhydrolase [Chitinophagaceae bacterium]